MTGRLEELGYSASLREHFLSAAAEGQCPGRIVEAYQDLYTVNTGDRALRCTLSGRLRSRLADRAAYPTTGDWVILTPSDATSGVIHDLMPRRGVLFRRAAGERTAAQAIASHIDVAVIVQSADRDFSVNRIDRYVSIARAAGIRPIAVINKSDLVSPEEIEVLCAAISSRHPGLRVVTSSVLDTGGLAGVSAELIPGETCCFLGSSGVGKSTLINALMGRDCAATGGISEATQRGRHTTTSRTLFALPGGALVIDTPGMRELGLADAGAGVEDSFAEIRDLARACRFSDCTHQGEPGCAVRAAIDEGSLEPAALDSYLRLRREARRFEQSAAELRRTERKHGKMIKQILREKRDRW